jgi:hypothetical protein
VKTDLLWILHVDDDARPSFAERRSLAGTDGHHECPATKRTVDLRGVDDPGLDVQTGACGYPAVTTEPDLEAQPPDGRHRRQNPDGWDQPDFCGQLAHTLEKTEQLHALRS